MVPDKILLLTASGAGVFLPEKARQLVEELQPSASDVSRDDVSESNCDDDWLDVVIARVPLDSRLEGKERRSRSN